MSEQVRAIAMLSALGFCAVSVAMLVCEFMFTKVLDRPTRWSGASLGALVSAFVALTVAMWPLLAAGWPELWRLARGSG